tara:strand:- start:8118 stop:9767 length:1650 start_codon:yes stop_codon:yes gene_type:complete
MNYKKTTTIMMTLLFAASAFAGCLDDNESNFDEADGPGDGYIYASNVDNHRMMTQDVCDIKDLAESHDWDEITEIYEDGKYAEKSDGSFRTLKGFADATGKQHGLDTYYGVDTPLDDFLMSALEGTGMFEGTSDSVREQAVEKGVQNQMMVAYAIHELNAAINKAEAGNFGTNDAQHAWDEGWAFYHGLDEYASCSPYATGDKRAGNFGTAQDDGTANANAAILQAMNDGLAALEAEDLDAAKDARDEVVKQLVIIYSQATIRYAHKMNTDDTVEKAQTHQSEGYAFWRVIEKYVAEANPSPGDDCYNGVTMTVSAAAADECAGYMYMTDYDMGDGQDICYNMDTHAVSADDSTSCVGYVYVTDYDMGDGQDICYNMESHSINGDNQSVCESYAWYDNASWGSTTYTGCYNDYSHQTTNDSQAVCEAYGYYENYGATMFTGCYNTVTHGTDADMSQTTCESFGWYENYGATMFTGCYNMVSHTTDADMAEAECDAFAYFDGFGTTGINGIYDFSNVPVEGTDYQAAVRAHLQPAWDMLGITAEDIGTLQ